MKIENNILSPIQPNHYLHEINDIGSLSEDGLYWPPDLKEAVYFAINYTPTLEEMEKEYEVMTLDEFAIKRDEWIAELEKLQQQQEENE